MMSDPSGRRAGAQRSDLDVSTLVRTSVDGGGMARILVLDDDAPTRSALSVMLASLGHDPIEVASAAEAEVEHRVTPVDLILVDLAGDTECESVRQLLADHPDLPCLAAEDGPDLGPDAQVVKNPLRLGELYESLEDVFDGMD